MATIGVNIIKRFFHFKFCKHPNYSLREFRLKIAKKSVGISLKKNVYRK